MSNVDQDLIVIANVILGKGWPYMLLATFFVLVFFYFTISDITKRASMLRRIAIGVILFSLFRSAVLSIALHRLWSSGPPAQYLLPPHQSISYFLHYIYFHFFFALLLSSCVAFVVGAFFIGMNKVRPQAIKPGDTALFISGLFLVRWPEVLLYVFLVFVSASLYAFLCRVILGRERMVDLGAFILFSILPFILFSQYIIPFFGMQTLLMPR